MDPITTSVIKAATGAAAAELKKESDGFLKAVFGQPARALGGLLTDRINKRRHGNLIGITVEAKRRLAEAGVSPREVPLSIIHPALETASLEEEAGLQTVWANLLANAADPRQEGKVLPSFPAILKELTSRDVKFLDMLYETTLEKFASSAESVGGGWR